MARHDKPSRLIQVPSLHAKGKERECFQLLCDARLFDLGPKDAEEARSLPEERIKVRYDALVRLLDAACRIAAMWVFSRAADFPTAIVELGEVDVEDPHGGAASVPGSAAAGANAVIREAPPPSFSSLLPREQDVLLNIVLALTDSAAREFREFKITGIGQYENRVEDWREKIKATWQPAAEGRQPNDEVGLLLEMMKRENVVPSEARNVGECRTAWAIVKERAGTYRSSCIQKDRRQGRKRNQVQMMHPDDAEAMIGRPKKSRMMMPEPVGRRVGDHAPGGDDPDMVVVAVPGSVSSSSAAGVGVVGGHDVSGHEVVGSSIVHGGESVHHHDRNAYVKADLELPDN